MFSVARPSKIVLYPFQWWPERVSNALVGLLTLRLPSLGWVLTRLLRHSYLISLLCLRYPLSFVLSCFFRCPARGLAACRYFFIQALHLAVATPYGETLHSFRAGLAITLALSGSQLADTMEHVGWRHAPTASHYLKVVQVLRPGGPSDLLSRHDPSAQALADSYTDLNSLHHFTVAFFHWHFALV